MRKSSTGVGALTLFRALVSRLPSLAVAGIAIGSFSYADRLEAQVLDGLKRQTESAVVHKGGQVIREAIDCAVGDPKCDKPAPSTPPAPDAPPGTPAGGPAAAPALIQEFSATVTPWITRDTQGWDHITDRVTFSGTAVAGSAGNEHQILLCDPDRKWRATFRFFGYDDVSALETRDYPISPRIAEGVILAGIYMPLASRFREGAVTLDSVGPDVVTGTARARYDPSGYLRLQSGTLPKEHVLEASFQARIVPTLTRESVPACFWE